LQAVARPTDVSASSDHWRWRCVKVNRRSSGPPWHRAVTSAPGDNATVFGWRHTVACHHPNTGPSVPVRTSSWATDRGHGPGPRPSRRCAVAGGGARKQARRL